MLASRQLRGAVEFDGGGVAEGVEDAEEQVGGDQGLNPSVTHGLCRG